MSLLTTSCFLQCSQVVAILYQPSGKYVASGSQGTSQVGTGSLHMAGNQKGRTEVRPFRCDVAADQTNTKSLSVSWLATVNPVMAMKMSPTALPSVSMTNWWLMLL